MPDQSRFRRGRNSLGAVTAAIFFCAIAMLLAPQTQAKMNVDFNPNLDFSKYETFAYIGGVEHLVTRQLNPDEIRDTVHEEVARELTKHGLREVKPDANPDLVVRYLLNTGSQVNFAATGNFGGFDPYIEDFWAYSYDLWNASVLQEGSMMIDLIDAKRKDLAWRLFMHEKILNADKTWAKVKEEIIKGFEGYPPTEKMKEEKRKERAEHPPKPKKPQFQ